MALAIWQGFVLDQFGNVMPNASIEVKQMVAGFPPATVFSDRDGTTVYNPITSDAGGFVRFFAPGGAYRIVATKGALSITFDFVAIGRGAEIDPGTIVTFNATESGDINAFNPASSSNKAVRLEDFFEGLIPTDNSPTSTFAPDLTGSRKINVNVTENLTIGLPSGGFVGLDFLLYFKIGNGTAPTVTFGSGYFTPDGNPLTIPTDENAVCRVHCDVRSVDGSGDPDEVWITLAGSNFVDLGA